MTVLADSDRHDVRVATRATGLLREFNQAGVLSAADVHVATALGRLGNEPEESVLLAAALAVRAVRLGSVCIDLEHVSETAAADDEAVLDVSELAWPDVDGWFDAIAASAIVAVGVDGDPARPLRLSEGLLYLDRYWRQQELVRHELDDRLMRPELLVDTDLLGATLDRLFGPSEAEGQRLAGEMAARRSVLVLAGGPGTGKTTTVARLLHLLRALAGGNGASPRIALAAPTGKAAARLEEAVTETAIDEGLDVGDVRAATLHRLLGYRMGSRSRFRHDRLNRLPYDVVVIDESSMVSLTMMSRLLEAVPRDARLILVGDPDQLASVEAGAVLADLIERPVVAGATVPVALAHQTSDPLRNGVVRLTTRYRYGEEIGRLADAVRDGHAADAVELMRAGGDNVTLIEADVGGRLPPEMEPVRGDVLHSGRRLIDAARSGDVAGALKGLSQHRLLCAHRRGPYGVVRWTAEIERWLAGDIDDYSTNGEWYVGRPLLATSNDYDVEVFNGDTGVIVDGGSRGPLAAFARGAEPVLLSPGRLTSVQTVHAMTIHRGQGSQFDTVTVVLPPPESPLLTRELLYTAITRAETHVRVVGSAESIQAAVDRPVVRASGLRSPVPRRAVARTERNR